MNGRAFTKKELVCMVAEETALTQVQVKDVVQRTLDHIVDGLVSDGRIEFRNFGIYEVHRRKARLARNPRTGATISVPPRNVVVFTPGRILKERLNNQPFSAMRSTKSGEK